jgi:YVTN family beta-propeller protein
VPNFYSANIRVIDCVRDSLLDTLPLTGFGCSKVMSNSDGSRLYCINDPYVSIINVGNHQIQFNDKTGSSPTDMCYLPSRTQVYVSNGGDNTVSVIDDMTHRVTATIGVGEGATALTVAPERGRVYCACEWACDIYVIDALVGIQEPVKPVSLLRPALELYPNPCRGRLNLSFGGDIARDGRTKAPIRIDLYDVAGRQVKEWRLPAAGNGGAAAVHTSLDLKGLANGVYYVTLGTGSTRWSKQYRAKIVVQR